MLSPIHSVEHMVSEIQNKDLVHIVRDHSMSAVASILLLSFRGMVERYLPAQAVAVPDDCGLCRNVAGCEPIDEFYKKQVKDGCV